MKNQLFNNHAQVPSIAVSMEEVAVIIFKYMYSMLVGVILAAIPTQLIGCYFFNSAARVHGWVCVYQRQINTYLLNYPQCYSTSMGLHCSLVIITTFLCATMLTSQPQTPFESRILNSVTLLAQTPDSSSAGPSMK